jgi:hypothetical protein
LRPFGTHVVYAPNRDDPFIAKRILAFGHPSEPLFCHEELGLVERAYSLFDLTTLFPELRLEASGVVEYDGELWGYRRRLSFVCGVYKHCRSMAVPQTL